ncbi:Conserved_hypothetical protein [Hexamita inflata]|uniref:Uncharacterized protein n=1 Tax=Hexamita inflata TaxID=28002 RepID=A0AA86R7W3_9EUKA|nr:Conserved hypothetical protein [Hexamita inflata]
MIFNNVSAINTTATNIRSDLTTNNANMISLTNGLRTDLTGTQSSVSLLRVDTYNNFTSQQLDISNIFSNLTAINITATVLRNDFSSQTTILTNNANTIRADLTSTQNQLSQLKMDQQANNTDQQNQISVIIANLSAINSTAQSVRNDLITNNANMISITNALRTDQTATQTSVSILRADTYNNFTSQQADISRIFSNISAINSTATILRNDFTSQTASQSATSSVIRADLTITQNALNQLKLDAQTNNSNILSQLTVVFSNLSAINSTATQIRTDLTSLNNNAILLTNTLRTDLNALISSVSALKTEAQNNFSFIVNEVQRINSNLTAINVTAVQTKTDLNTLNTNLDAEVLNRIQGDNLIMTKFSTLDAAAKTNHTDIITKLSANEALIAGLRAESTSNYSFLTFADSAMQGQITSNKNDINTAVNSINLLWAKVNQQETKLQDIKDNTYSRQVIDSNFSQQAQVNRDVVNNMSMKALKKPVCSERFMIMDNNTMKMYYFPFYNVVESRCCASFNGLSVYCYGPGSCRFSYVCQNWDDPTIIENHGAAIQGAMLTYCGEYPCRPDIPQDKECQ